MSIRIDEFVHGRPATFATAGERPWKETIAASLASVVPDVRSSFLELDFALAPIIGYAEGGDLDNLCEPVFSVLASRLGWFAGRRPNVRAFRARKTVTGPTGCRFRITDDRWDDRWIDGDVLLDGVADGPLPISARDPAFAAWAAITMKRQAWALGPLAVELEFAAAVNLGDIATGPLKSVVDCLYPVLGGRVGTPNDARITILEATRVQPDVSTGVRVHVTQLAR